MINKKREEQARQRVQQGQKTITQEQMWLEEQETRSEKWVGFFSHSKESVGTGLGGVEGDLPGAKQESDMI